MENTDVKIDFEKIRLKASEAANNAYLQEVKDYFEGHNSPYRKAIKESLHKQGLDNIFIKLPDIMGIINDAINLKVIEIANTAIANTFIPYIQEILTGVKEQQIHISDIVEKFKEYILDEYNVEEGDVLQFSKEENKNGWISIKLTYQDCNYNLTLHKNYKVKGKDQTYELLSIPYTSGTQSQYIRIKTKEASIDLPFSKSVLENIFLRYATSLILGSVEILDDSDDISEEIIITEEED